jgi:hypothetical protein
MTRRDFIWTAAAAATRSSAPAPLVVPIHRVVDARAQVPPERRQHFWSSIWPEAFRAFSRGGIELQTGDGPGEVKRSPGDRPIFVGLRRGALNLVLTDHIPMYWDRGRSLAGVTTVYDGYHVCMVAMLYAHGNQVPYLSTNTCVHELLHALLQDILVSHPKWYQVSGREFRADWYATQLWLGQDGAEVRKSARVYLERLRGAGAVRAYLDGNQTLSIPTKRPKVSLALHCARSADEPNLSKSSGRGFRRFLS